MAFIEMNCGPCESGVQIDSGENVFLESQVALFAERFANAHSQCGFMTPPASNEVANEGRRTNVVRLGKREVTKHDDGDEASV